MASGECPKCGKTVSAVNGEHVNVKTSGKTLHGLSYYCQSCNAVLSVTIDPVALKTDIVDEIVRELKKAIALAK